MANGNVDELNIEISAQAKSAVKSMNELVSSVKNAGNQAQKAVSNFRSLSKEIGSVASAFKSMNSVSAKNMDFSGITKTIRSIGKIDASSAQKTADSIKRVTESLSASGQIKFNESGMNKVVNSVRNLVSVDLSKFNAQNFHNIISSISSLGQMPDVSSGVNRLVSSLARLSNAGEKTSISASGISILASETKKAVQQLSGIGSVSDDIVQFVQAIAQLASSGPKASQAAAGLKELTPQLVKFITAMKDAPSVNKNTLQLVQSLSQLSAAGGRVGTASKSIVSGLTSMNAPMKNATKSTLSLAAAFGKFYASFWLIIRAFNAIGKAMDISSSLTEVQNVVDVTFGDMASKVENLAQTSIEQFGMSELSMKQYASRFQAMGTAMGANNNAIAKANEFLNKQTNGYVGLSDQMADVSLNLTKLTADMSSFYNVSQSEMATALQSVFTGETEPLRRFGLDLSFATVEAWALANGLNADMQSMTQSEKTMLRYQYVLANTAAAQNDFQRTSNSWANQTRILAQNFEQLASIIGGVFINALKPLVQALNAAMSSIMSFAQTIADALGAIFGWTIESTGGGILNDMATSAGEVADGLGDAVGQAKKLNKSLQSFNELNVIRLGDDSGGSGGGTGGGGTTGGGSQVNIVQTESLIEKYKSEIENLYQLGEYIGETITNTLNSIDWNSVYQGARNFGKGLADFLNGLISPELFGAVGRTIASALNTAIYAALSFGETFDFKDFGLSIASAINNFFETFDFGALAETINVWVQGIFDLITAAIANIDWKYVWKGIVDFLGNLDLGTVSIIIGALAIKEILSYNIAGNVLAGIGKGIASQLAGSIYANFGIVLSRSVISSVLTNAGMSMGTTLVAGFKALVGSEAAASALAFVSPVVKAVTGIGAALGGVAMAVTSFFAMWENGFSWLNEALMVVGVAVAAVGAVILGVPAGIAAGVAAAVAAIGTVVVLIHDNWDAIVETFSNAADWFNQNVIQPIADFFKGLWDTVSGFFSDLRGDIQEIWSTVSDWFDENVVQPIKTVFDWLKETVEKIFEGLWIIIQAVWIVVSGWFNKHVIQPIVGFFTSLYNKVSSIFSTLWGVIQSVWSVVSGWFNTYVISPISSAFSSATGMISNLFSNLWGGIQWVWSTVSGWFTNNVINPVVNSFWDVYNGVKYVFDLLGGAIKSAIVSGINGAISAVEGGINFIIDGVNNVIKGFNKLVGGAAKIVGVKWSNIGLVSRVSLPRVSGFENGGYPRTADLFWANENGVPELVGTMNGRTAVASGTEITGISDAIYGTGNIEIQLLQEQNRLLRQLLAKDTGISANDLFNSVRNSSKDYTARTGRPAFDF